MMKIIKTLILILVLVLVSSLIVACGNSEPKQENFYKNFEGGDRDVKENEVEEVNSEAVNFKCDIQGLGTLYFLKGNARIDGTSSTTWVLDGHTYAVMPLGEEEIIIDYEGDAGMEPMSNEDMLDTYKNSKMNPGVTCTLGVVSQADMALPKLRILTNDEFQMELMDSMMAQYEQ